MKVLKYVDENGAFDYELYRRIQEEGNKRKLEKVWASEEVIEAMALFARSNVKSLRFGLCHGTRRGLEQEWFAKYTGAPFLGTEISSTAAQFPNTIQWDFHEVKDEWIGGVDVIYSNSWDHSYDPERCFRAWMRCLSPGGLMLLEHSAYHGEAGATELDPFGIGLDELALFLTELGQGAFSVVAVLRDLSANRKLRKINLAVLALQRRETPIDLTSWRDA